MSKPTREETLAKFRELVIQLAEKDDRITQHGSRRVKEEGSVLAAVLKGRLAKDEPLDTAVKAAMCFYKDTDVEEIIAKMVEFTAEPEEAPKPDGDSSTKIEPYKLDTIPSSHDKPKRRPIGWPSTDTRELFQGKKVRSKS